MKAPPVFHVMCPQRGCVVPLHEGDDVPELCPTCRNPLAVLMPSKHAAPKRAHSSRAPGARSSAKTPQA
jgi:hypothetical protein